MIKQRFTCELNVLEICSQSFQQILNYLKDCNFTLSLKYWMCRKKVKLSKSAYLNKETTQTALLFLSSKEKKNNKNQAFQLQNS